MKPDTVFRWLLIAIFFGISILGLLDYFEISFVLLNDFLFRYRSVLISLGTLLVILLTTIFATHLSNNSAEKRQKADRLVNAELKLSVFRQDWINVLRQDLAEFISISYGYFQEPKEDEKNVKLEQLKRLDAQIRMRLNPKEDALQERKIEGLIVELILMFEIGKEDVAMDIREKLAEEGAIFLKDQWEELKWKLEVLKQEDGSP